ncbi:hypothetical protein Anas_01536 [Armadillidium nasatum]|uniref:Uncharacterized protein n=1 Tax=Armadillidium nasatum TaxID=96803 RepID=A0A5N5TCA0_9CRUS|nr:hypothetical protein Anas_01536 [Armadillidium nasatum]
MTHSAKFIISNLIASLPGARPHVIFAKSEVRITLYDNGDAAKTYPTGFEAEIEVIDLFDTEEYKHFIEKKATPKIRRKTGILFYSINKKH